MANPEDIALKIAAVAIGSLGSLVLAYASYNSLRKSASPVRPTKNVPAFDVPPLEEDDPNIIKRQAFVLSMRMLFDDAIQFLDEKPTAKFFDWIKHVHKENTHGDRGLDKRINRPESQHCLIWTQLKSVRTHEAWSRLLAFSESGVDRVTMSNWEIQEGKEGRIISGELTPDLTSLNPSVQILVYVNGYGRAVTPSHEFELGVMAPDYNTLRMNEGRSALYMVIPVIPEPSKESTTCETSVEETDTESQMAASSSAKRGSDEGDERPSKRSRNSPYWTQAFEKYKKFWSLVPSVVAEPAGMFLRLSEEEKQNIVQQDMAMFDSNTFGTARLRQVCSLPNTLFMQRHNRVSIPQTVQTGLSESEFYTQARPEYKLIQFPLQPHKRALAMICAELQIQSPADFQIDPPPEAATYQTIMTIVDQAYFGGELLSKLGHPLIHVSDGYHNFRAEAYYELEPPIIRISSGSLYFPPISPKSVHRSYQYSVLVESNLERAMITICHELTHIAHHRLYTKMPDFWRQDFCRPLEPVGTHPHGKNFLELTQGMWGLGSDYFFEEPKYKGAEGAEHKDGGMKIVAITEFFFQVAHNSFVQDFTTISTAITDRSVISELMDAAAEMDVTVHTFDRVTDHCIMNRDKSRKRIEECWPDCDPNMGRDPTAWKSCWQKKAKETHPDKGGTTAAFQALQACDTLIKDTTELDVTSARALIRS